MSVRLILGAVAGAALGLAAWKFIGCRTGACPLTANPFVSMALWGMMGLLLVSGR